MKSAEIKVELENLETDVKKKITEMGVPAVADITKDQRSNLIAWVFKRRKFSYKKILDIAEKIGL